MGDTALLLILMIMFPTSAPVGCSDFSEIAFIRSSGGFFFLGKPADNSGTNQAFPDFVNDFEEKL